MYNPVYIIYFLPVFLSVFTVFFSTGLFPAFVWGAGFFNFSFESVSDAEEDVFLTAVLTLAFPSVFLADAGGVLFCFFAGSAAAFTVSFLTDGPEFFEAGKTFDVSAFFASGILSVLLGVR